MSVKKNLIFASASFHPWNYQKYKFKKSEHKEREGIYALCFNQLKRVVPENFEVYIVENTINSKEEIYTEDLKNSLDRFNILFSKDQRGTQTDNIGVAELRQLFHLDQKIDFQLYEKVAFLTSRRIVTNPYVFEKTQELQKDALLCNPDYLYLSGKFEESEKKDMYSDMFFSMKTKTMIDYIKFSKERLEYLDENMISTEINLYDFIQTKNISFEYIETIGFLRYIYQSDTRDLKDKFVIH